MFDNVKNGTYYVLLKSKNRNFTSTVEIMGQIYIEEIILEGSMSKDVSNNFSIR